MKNDSESGTLYLVPTPIGNLEDITLRAIRILKETDLILAEDTRNTQKLLNHFEIMTKSTSFHEHNSESKIPQIIDMLKDGKDISQVSDAGMPSVSDPGADLVGSAIQNGIEVVALPGASAGITALIASGLDIQPYMFYGFLPRSHSQQQKLFEKFKAVDFVTVFYESPYRINKTLSNFQEYFDGKRRVVVARELTKKFEEYFRGTIDEAVAWFKEHNPKGEFVIILGPSIKENIIFDRSDTEIIDLINNEISEGDKPNAAIKKIAKELKRNRQEIYNIFHNI